MAAASLAVPLDHAPLNAQAQPVPSPRPITPPTRTDLLPPDRRSPERAVTLTIDGDLERGPCALDRADYQNIRLTLSGAQFGGIERAPGVVLDEAYEGYLGRELPISVLCDIRAKANAILRRDGYLATVEIPEQSLADGVADFRIVFGRIAALRVRGEGGPSEQTVARYLEKLTEQPVFNSFAAERYLLLADDLPGIEVRLSLRPAVGGEPGDLVGEIAVVRQRGALDANFQNLGSEALGRFGGTLRGEIYDLTGLGDRTYLTAFTTLDFVEQQTFQIGHDFAIGGEGLRLGGSLTYSTAEPDSGLDAFDLGSETVIASLFASYPLQRSRQSSAFLNLGVDIVDQNVEVNATALTRDRVRTLFARVSGDHIDRESMQRLGGYNPYEPRLRLTYTAELRQGIDVFSASRDCRDALTSCLADGLVPPSRVEADPTPFVARLQGGMQFRPVPRLTFSLEALGQIAGAPLPAFEEFAGGSFSIGRGFDPGVVLGDDGIAGAFEIRYGSLAPQGPEDLAVQPYVFTDIVRVWNQDPSRVLDNPDQLWSAGAGIRSAWGARVQGDLLIAVPLERPDIATRLGDVRVLFTLTARLLPWRY
ncbi:MAG: ShlB/FhaC/HecB family hemolysin secretion/activation protein [Erythrobacter sp.]|jgi:hemolysin activation/secretion protein|nr:ShlB/FhaC/HecB family hemolysin secretion/activation protein [Erythrobacter sp.]